MMLRPATPLAVLLLVAFALLLVSTLSVPIITSIPLATFSGVNFGVFGFCEGSFCTSVEIGYDASSHFSTSEDASFDLPDSFRSTVSAILIFHPIAALFALIMFGLAATAHLHSPSHSPRYLLGVFILSLFTFILSLLAFLIDVLLFAPHMAWGSYLVLAATVLIAASSIVACAMRRTLVSRKARKRRIQENAEMNGENYYSDQGQIPIAPLVTMAAVDKIPTVATFEQPHQSEPVADERIPLTSEASSDVQSGRMGEVNGGVVMNGYGGPTPGREYAASQRDEYGNPLPPSAPSYGSRSREPSRDPSTRGQYADPNMRSRGGFASRGGYVAYNGREGYAPPPPGPGGYGPPRGPNGSVPGPYRTPPPGSMGPGGMRGRGPPPMDYPAMGPPPGGRGYGQTPSPGPAYGPPSYRRRPSADSFAPNPVLPSTSSQNTYVPDADDLPRAESPPPLPEQTPVGQAVEMDASTGSPAYSPVNFVNNFGGIRDSDGDVAGMVGLQQRRLSASNRHNTMRSETSHYSAEEPYVPPRAQWDQPETTSRRSPPVPTQSPAHGLAQPQNPTGGAYYEDVAPEFASHDPQPSAQPDRPYPNPNAAYLQRPHVPLGQLPDSSRSYEEMAPGQRSPVESESGFTSISQRSVNPRWNGGSPVPRAPPPQQQRRDLLLSSNPDFELPAARGGAGRGRLP